MLAPVRHISPLTLIQRERVLPVSGQVIARQGQAVSPNDVVAECILAPRYFMLNIAEGLNLTPERADKLLQCQKGDNVSKGDMIAGPAGVFQRVVRTPYSGRVKLTGEGKVLIEAIVSPFELKAGFDGKVKRIIPDWGVVIETRGALIQGMWGNGKAAYGLVQTMLKDPADELTVDQVNISVRGAIVIGGYCQDPQVLESAAKAPIKGLILGSMSSALLPLAEKMTFPIIILDGFGQIPMNSIAYKLLTTTTKDRDISLHAQAYQSSKGNRPEIIVSLPSLGLIEPLLETDAFSSGQKVYLVNKSYTSQTGIIEHFLAKPFMFPSGIIAPAAVIRLDNNDLVKVPLASLETFGEKTNMETY